MPKNIEDIVPSPRRKSIRDIPLPDRRATPRERVERVEDVAHKRRKEPPVRVEDSVPRIEVAEHHAPRHHRRKSKKKFWITLVAIVAVLAFAGMAVFDGATLAYTPKSADLTFNRDIYAANKTGDAGLLFSVVKLSGDKAVVVKASGEQDVSRKASGVIVVYNNHSSEPQRLVVNTRFESPDGKIYRATKDINIPGKSGGQPGSVEVLVVADQPGEAYNIGLTDFTVPGLKSTPRAITVYARSKTPMAGGFVGKEKSVDPQELASAKAALQADLKKELEERTRAQVPEDFILFPTLSTTTFEDLPQTPAGEGVNINLRGNFYGVMFKRADLAQFLAKRKTQVATGESVEIPGLPNLAFSFAGEIPRDLITVNQISFAVEGKAKALWFTDEAALKEALKGKEKREVSSVLRNYPSIAKAEAIIRPFWKKTFPEETGDITIKRLNP